MQDGSIYVIMPDAPLIEYPINQTVEFGLVALSAMKIGRYLRLDLFTYKHFLALYGLLLVLLYHFFIHLVSFFFRSIEL